MAYREMTEAELEQVSAKIENEGIDYYFCEGGWGKKDFAGTAIEPLAQAYEAARAALLDALGGLGVLDGLDLDCEPWDCEP